LPTHWVNEFGLDTSHSMTGRWTHSIVVRQRIRLSATPHSKLLTRCLRDVCGGFS
jgi:hypothetical protein